VIPGCGNSLVEEEKDGEASESSIVQAHEVGDVDDSLGMNAMNDEIDDESGEVLSNLALAMKHKIGIMKENELQ